MQYMADNFYRPLSRQGQERSETSFLVNLFALIVSVALVGSLSRLLTPLGIFLSLATALLVSTLFFEWLFFPKTCWLAHIKVRRKLSLARVAFREIALIVTLGAIGLAYWLFPMFAIKKFETTYFPFLKYLIPFLLVASLPYFCIMDKIDTEEDDVYCRFGRAILTWRRTLTRFEFANYIRSWLIKAFWLSLMQPDMMEKIKIFLCYNWHKLSHDDIQIYAMAATICFGIDLCYASVGYIMNFKMFNTHTRTAEPTLVGWVVAIVCYWPFWECLVCPYFLPYPVKEWETLFPSGGVIWWTWAISIILLEFLYAMSTVSAGIRFSNLTYRGLWATGLYRLTKHPAYVFKNISWWMIYAPTIIFSGSNAIKQVLFLLGINLIYFMRARTEERHLSAYPEYVAYAEEMNDKGMFRHLTKIVPLLAYRRPTR